MSLTRVIISAKNAFKLNAKHFLSKIPNITHKSVKDKKGNIMGEYFWNNYTNSLLIGFSGKRDSRYTKIITSFTPKVLNTYFSLLDNSNKTQINEVLRGTKLELPLTFNEQRQEHTNLLERVNSKKIELSNVDFSHNIARGVVMHEVAFTNPASEKYILGAFSLKGSIAIALRNKENKSIALACVDVLTDISSIIDIFYNIRNGNEKIEVFLAGGSSRSKKFCTELIRLIENIDNTEIMHANLASDDNKKSLAINARTGQIYEGITVNNLDCGKDVEFRLRKLNDMLQEKVINSEQFALNLIYDGRNQKTNQERKNFRDLNLTKFETGIDNI